MTGRKLRITHLSSPRAVYRQLHRMQHEVIAMEDYVARDDRSASQCLSDVSHSDLYLGLFAWRYGFVPTKDNPRNLSITELECHKAETNPFRGWCSYWKRVQSAAADA